MREFSDNPMYMKRQYLQMAWNEVPATMDSWNAYRPQPQIHHQPQQQQYGGDESQRTLYVGNLSKEVTQDYILYLFSQYGHVKSCKMITDPAGINDPYCFVEFNDSKDADNARISVNGRVVIGKTIKVNWAATSSAKKDKTYSLFVGDLTPDVDEESLIKVFKPFGVVIDARVVKDQNTGISKGYGFVAFAREDEAENAMKKMHGMVVGGKAIRTNWASRKQNQTKGETKNYKDVFSKTSDANTTVYIGNTPDNFSESDVRSLFSPHGDISEVRVYADRNYAFVKFADHEQAARAICGLHGQTVQDRSLKCDWGKEDGNQSKTNMGQPSFMQQQQQQQQQQAYQQAAFLYNSLSAAQQPSPFQQQAQQQFSGNPPPGMYSQQQAMTTAQQMYPSYFDSMQMMQAGQFPGYGQDSSHNTFMGGGSNSAATSQGSFGGYPQ